ncbi:MAG: redoxin domain-containing protein [Fibromonadaceae bacterium]|nr:redoxin domain-containing protein [Fibromonadaceae bacterium]
MQGITYLFVLLLALTAFAEPSKKLPLPKELQGELPWFAFDKKEGNGVINNDNLKELANQKKYRKVVFSFFATWCLPCREGLKRMSESANELKKNGVLVVLVNVAERGLENYSRKKIDEWTRQNGYLKEDWLLVFDKFSNSLEDFGLQKSGNEEAPLPRTLVTDENLRPLMLIGSEGDDYVQILLSEPRLTGLKD